jgi:hypothetical protein
MCAVRRGLEVGSGPHALGATILQGRSFSWFARRQRAERSRARGLPLRTTIQSIKNRSSIAVARILLTERLMWKIKDYGTVITASGGFLRFRG